MSLLALAALLFQAAPPLVRREQVLVASLEAAVRKMRETSTCSLRAPLGSDLLTVIGAYEGATLSNVTVAGQDAVTTVAGIAIERGSAPIYLAVSSNGPVIWRITGDTRRVRHMAVVHQQGAGVVGIPRERIEFSRGQGCDLRLDDYQERTAVRANGERDLEHEVPILAIFGRRANLIGGDYGLYKAVISTNTLTVDRSLATDDHDKIVTDPPSKIVFPHGKGGPPSSLEVEFKSLFPAGIAALDSRTVVATGSVEPYAVLPQTAGALQLENSGALIPATAADVRRWKDRAILAGKISARDIGDLYFDSAYRVTRPIHLPAGLCGGFSLTFFVPSRSSVSGEPCHSNIYVDDGTIMATPMLPGR